MTRSSNHGLPTLQQYTSGLCSAYSRIRMEVPKYWLADLIPPKQSAKLSRRLPYVLIER